MAVYCNRVVCIFAFLTAMQNEYKVMRLQFQAIFSHISYLVEELQVDEVVPHLVQRRLLTEAEGKEVVVINSQLERVYKIMGLLEEYDSVTVGIMPTFYGSLVGAGLLHVAKMLNNSEYYLYVVTCEILTTWTHSLFQSSRVS